MLIFWIPFLIARRVVMKRIICTITGLILGLGVVTALSAEEVKTFEDLDINADGYISKDEAAAQKSIKRNWAKVDADKNDRIDISEFSAFESEGRFTPPEESEVAEPGAAPF
jgi:hypothetical protein